MTSLHKKRINPQKNKNGTVLVGSGMQPITIKFFLAHPSDMHDDKICSACDNHCQRLTTGFKTKSYSTLANSFGRKSPLM